MDVLIADVIFDSLKCPQR